MTAFMPERVSWFEESQARDTEHCASYNDGYVSASDARDAKQHG